MRMPRSILSSVVSLALPHISIYPHYLTKDMIFEKKKYISNVIRVF